MQDVVVLAIAVAVLMLASSALKALRTMADHSRRLDQLEEASAHNDRKAGVTRG